MVNQEMRDTEVSALLSSGRKEIDKYLLTSVIEIKEIVRALPCRVCNEKEDRRTWAMWGVLTTLAERVFLPSIVAVLSVLVTLAIR